MPCGLSPISSRAEASSVVPIPTRIGSSIERLIRLRAVRPTGLSGVVGRRRRWVVSALVVRSVDSSRRAPQSPDVRGVRLIGIAVVAWCVALRPADAREPSVDPPCVVQAQVTSIVNGATAAYLQSAIASAESQRCSVLVRLDTPGGLMDATRDIVRSFLGAPVPVVVYVAPSGARAGSAGVFITMAAHVAAMAPGSNIGAAHPVLVGPGGDDKSDEVTRKVVSDAAALARAIAGERGRNAKWAEKAVRESASLTAHEALAENVVDLLAESERELLERLDGREVTVAGVSTTLRTRGARLLPQSMTFQQRALQVLGDPNVTYLLFMLGLLGITIELYNPGLLVPGGLGLLFLLLGAVGMNILPINALGVLLLVAAVALFVGELYTTSFGLLTLAGLLALLAGAALLFDWESPDFFADARIRLSWGLVVPLALLLSVASALLAWHVKRTAQSQPMTGKEGLLGASGKALSPIDARGGTVLVLGERWSAVSSTPVAAEQAVRVIRVDRLQLTVAPLEDRPPDTLPHGTPRNHPS